MRVFSRASLACAGAVFVCAAGAAPLRPPSVPLVTVDPFFSVWSPADKLADAPTEHWSGQAQPMTALLRVDGKAYRLLGSEPADVLSLPQTSCTVLPLRTVCRFADAAVEAGGRGMDFREFGHGYVRALSSCRAISASSHGVLVPLGPMM